MPSYVGGEKGTSLSPTETIGKVIVEIDDRDGNFGNRYYWYDRSIWKSDDP